MRSPDIAICANVSRPPRIAGRIHAVETRIHERNERVALVGVETVTTPRYGRLPSRATLAPLAARQPPPAAWRLLNRGRSATISPPRAEREHGNGYSCVDEHGVPARRGP